MKRLSQDVVAVETGPNGSAIFIRQSCYPDPTGAQGIDLYIGNIDEVSLEPFTGARMVRPYLVKEQVVDLANALLAIANNEMWISTAKIEEK